MVKKNERKEIEPDSLSVKEYASLKGLNPHTVYRLIWSGQLTAERIGKSWRIPK